MLFVQQINGKKKQMSKKIVFDPELVKHIQTIYGDSDLSDRTLKQLHQTWQSDPDIIRQTAESKQPKTLPVDYSQVQTTQNLVPEIPVMEEYTGNIRYGDPLDYRADTLVAKGMKPMSFKNAFEAAYSEKDKTGATTFLWGSGIYKLERAQPRKKIVQQSKVSTNTPVSNQLSSRQSKAQLAQADIEKGIPEGLRSPNGIFGLKNDKTQNGQAIDLTSVMLKDPQGNSYQHSYFIDSGPLQYRVKVYKQYLKEIETLPDGPEKIAKTNACIIFKTRYPRLLEEKKAEEKRMFESIGGLEKQAPSEQTGFLSRLFSKTPKVTTTQGKLGFLFQMGYDVDLLSQKWNNYLEKLYQEALQDYEKALSSNSEFFRNPKTGKTIRIVRGAQSVYPELSLFNIGRIFSNLKAIQNVYKSYGRVQGDESFAQQVINRVAEKLKGEEQEGQQIAAQREQQIQNARARIAEQERVRAAKAEARTKSEAGKQAAQKNKQNQTAISQARPTRVNSRQTNAGQKQRLVRRSAVQRGRR